MSLALISKVRSLKRLKTQLAQERLQRTEQRRFKPAAGTTILDFQVSATPRLHRADHFAIYAKAIEGCVGSGLRFVFSAPPQHGKTEVTLHGLAWLLMRHPDKRFAYITYNEKRAKSVAQKVKRILAAAGVMVLGTMLHLQFEQGGQCLFSSVKAGIMGEPVDGAVFIDDPYKNRAEADSALHREFVESSYREGIETRVHPGAAIFLLATRWHPKDLSGVLIGEGWQNVNLPAIAENDNDPNGRAVGEPLFPKMWPVKALEEKKAKVLEFTWAALYQGRPRPKGGKVFHEPRFYSKRPNNFSGAYGVDLALTAKTSADWSVCVELWREDRDGRDAKGDKLKPLYYVIHVDRAQVEAPDFALTLRGRHVRRPRFRMLWRASGTEKGSAQFMRREDIPIEVEQPPGDKLVSATAVAAAWNDGRVLVPDTEFFPEAESWIHPFLDVVQNFTGGGKEIDDDVDGLGNAFEALERGSINIEEWVV
jgi:phage terminase large subunit-like protein